MSNRQEEQPTGKTDAVEFGQKIETNGADTNLVGALIERSELYRLPELRVATAVIINALRDADTNDTQLKLAWTEYAKIVEEFIESTTETTDNLQVYPRRQIEAIIHKSLIFQLVGNTVRYLEELDCADVYAYNQGFDDVSAIITTAITATVETLPLSSEVLILRLKGVMSENNRERLRDLIDEGDDFDDIISHVYGMLIDEGSDPDEILSTLGVF